MSKYRKIAAAAMVLLIVATVAFIWSNSLETRSESQEKSLSVMGKIKPLLEFFVGEGNVTDHLVRKLAHFSEFGLLGTEVALLMLVLNRRNRRVTVFCLLFGLAVASADETIQLFVDRGAQVSDVLLDFSGFVAGTALVLTVQWVVRKCKERRKQGVCK